METKNNIEGSFVIYLEGTYFPPFEVFFMAHEVQGGIYKYMLLENNCEVL